MASQEIEHTPLPGSESLPPPPLEEMSRLRKQRGPQYRPRSRHLRPDGWALYTNRLFLESSPYLLQHAHNPVNWFPWGEEAFSLARQLDRPLLVSIGYATCHWCHVMEEESFENEEIAEYLNRNFISVKVDREERPDVDSVYMNALHAMNMQGGWPLNVWLTPEGTPFYGGTYFPPVNHSRGVGFLSVLRALKEAYDSQREQVNATAEQLAQVVRRMTAPIGGAELPQTSLVELALESCDAAFDAENGGVRGAPKFPSSLPLRLLLRGYCHSGDHSLLHMVTHTLRKMAAGGICDQVGGGFHRYATDQHWLIPHFEKMLYDNALLAITYLEGYRATGDEKFAGTARQTLQYLSREMQYPGGAFFCATDADSPTPSGKREEGYFFTWTTAEVMELLGPQRGRTFATCHGMSERGNFEGRNILHLPRPLDEVARELRMREDELANLLEEGKETLYQARDRRPRPLRDEKILCSWNGLAVSAFATAGMALDEEAYLGTATRAAAFILEHMRSGERLSHSYQEGAAKGEAFLDDYAFFIAGLLDLFEGGAGVLWLEQALRLASLVVAEFEDTDAGGFFLTGAAHEKLIAREKPCYDGAIPSGNSVMIMNLIRLHQLTGETSWRTRAEKALALFSAVMEASPLAVSEMLLAVDRLLHPGPDIVVVAPQGGRQATRPLLQRLGNHFLPNSTVVTVSEGEELQHAEAIIPHLRGKAARGASAVAYLCENKTCQAATSDPQEFALQLQAAATRPAIKTR